MVRKESIRAGKVRIFEQGSFTCIKCGSADCCTIGYGISIRQCIKCGTIICTAPIEVN